MSVDVENKVVQMTFDNEQFERETRVTMKTLDELKKSLNLGDSAESFNEINAAIKKIDVSGLEKGVEEVKVKFSALEIAAIRAITRITDKVMDMGEKLVKSLSIDQITAGFKKYEDYTSSVQTIIAATDKSIEEVEFYLGKLNTFTDETSYNLTDMTNNIGKFTSNKILLEDAVVAMEGIATASALSGAKIQDASHAMEGFSNAIARGSMDLLNWKWIETAKLATAGFKESLIEAALAEGELIEKDGEIMTANEKAVVSIQKFNNTLSEKWMTSSVMMRALKSYGEFADRITQVADLTGVTTTNLLGILNDYRDPNKSPAEVVKDASLMMKTTIEDAQEVIDMLTTEEMHLGEQAFRAAQEAKTFSEAIDSVKDAVSTGWMKTFKIIFGNYEEAKKLWTDLAEGLYEVFAEGGEARNSLLQDWKDFGGRDKLLEGVYMLADQFNKLRLAFKGAIETIFPPTSARTLVFMTHLFTEFVKIVSLSDEALSGLQKVLTVLIAPLKIVTTLLKIVGVSLGIAVLIISEAVDSILRAVNDVDSVLTSLREFIGDTNFERIAMSLSIIGESILTIVVLVGRLAALLGGSLLHAISSLNLSGFGIKDKVIDALVRFLEILASFKPSEAFEAIYKIFDRIRGAVFSLIGSLNTLIPPVTRIQTLFERASKRFSEASGAAEKFKAVIDEIKKTLKGVEGVDAESKFLGANATLLTSKGVNDLKGAVQLSSTLKTNVEKTSLLAKVISGIQNVLKGAVGLIIQLGSALKNVFMNEKVLDVLSKFGALLIRVKDQIVAFVSGINPVKAVLIGLAISVIYLIKTFAGLLVGFRGIVDTATHFIETLIGATGVAYTINTITKLVITLTGAIVVLALLFKNERDNLIAAGLLLGGLVTWITVLTGALSIAARYLKITDALGAFGKVLLGMGAAVLATSYGLSLTIKVLKEMETLDTEKIWGNIKVLLALASGLMFFSAILSKIGGVPSIGVSFALVGFAFALTKAVEVLSTIDPKVYAAIGAGLKDLGKAFANGISALIEGIKKCDFKNVMAALIAGSIFAAALGFFFKGFAAAISAVSIKFILAIATLRLIVDSGMIQIIEAFGSALYTAVSELTTKLLELDAETAKWTFANIVGFITALGVVVTGLAVVAKFISAVGVGIASAFIGFSVSLYAILMFMNGLKQFTQQEIDNAIGIIKKFALIAAGLSVFAMWAGGRDFLKAAIAINLVGVALYPMIGALYLLKELVKTDTLGVFLAAGGIMVAFGVFFAGLMVAAHFAVGAGPVLAAVTLMVISVVSMIGLIIGLGDKIGEATNILIKLGLFIMGLGAAVGLLSTYGTGAAFPLLALAIALTALTGSIIALGYTPMPQLVQGFLSLAGAIVVFGGAVVLLGSPALNVAAMTGMVILNGIALAAVGLSIAMNVAADALKKVEVIFVGLLTALENSDLVGIAKGTALFAASLFTLALASASVFAMTPAVLTTCGLITLIGKSAEAASVGIGLFSLAVDSLIDKFVKAAGTINGSGISEVVKESTLDGFESLSEDPEAAEVLNTSINEVTVAAAAMGVNEESKSAIRQMIDNTLIDAVDHAMGEDFGAFNGLKDVVGNALIKELSRPLNDTSTLSSDVFAGLVNLGESQIRAYIQEHPEEIDASADALIDQFVTSMENQLGLKDGELKAVADALKAKLLEEDPQAYSHAAEFAIDYYTSGAEEQAKIKQGAIDSAYSYVKDTAINALKDQDGEAAKAAVEIIEAYGSSGEEGIFKVADVLGADSKYLPKSIISGSDSMLSEVASAARRVDETYEEAWRDSSGVHSESDKYFDLQTYVVKGAISGNASMLPYVNQSGIDTAMEYMKGIEGPNGFDLFNGSSKKTQKDGEAGGQGIIDGITSKLGDIINSAFTAAASFCDTIEDVLDERAPGIAAKAGKIADALRNASGAMEIDKTGWYSKDFETYDKYMEHYLKRSFDNGKEFYAVEIDDETYLRDLLESDKVSETDKIRIQGRIDAYERLIQAKKDAAKAGGGSGGSAKKEAKAEIAALDDLTKAYKRDTGAIAVMVENYRKTIDKEFGPGVKSQIDMKDATLAASMAMDKFAVSLYEAKDPANKLENQKKLLTETISYLKGETKDATEEVKELAKQTTEGATAEQRAWEATQIVVKNSIAGMTAALKEWEDETKQAIGSNLNLLGEVNKVEDISGYQMKENLEKNKEFYEDWMAGFEDFANMKDDTGAYVVSDRLLDRLRKMGPSPEGFKELFSWKDLELDDFIEAQEDFLEGLDYEKTFTERIKAVYAGRGMEASLGVVEGLEDGKENVDTAVTEFANSLIATCNEQLPPDKFYPNGKNITLGFAQGMLDSEAIAELENAVEYITSMLEFEAEKNLDEHSPSRVFAGIGKFIDLGLAQGILDNATEPVSAIGMLTNTISNIGRRINGELDLNPVIRPTLDLSSVTASARGISSIFNKNRSVGILAEEEGADGSGKGTYTFVQNNYSPKALSRIDIYRQTRNQFAEFREVANGI